MIALKLNQKLFLFWFGSICLSLLLFGAVFLFLSNELHQNSIHEQIDEAFDALDRQLNDRDQYLFHTTSLFAKRVDIVASMNMIYTYQDLENYQSIVFDVEKKKLSLELANLIKSEGVDIITVHDGNNRLTSFVYLDDSGQVKSGYLSYDNGIPGYFLSSTDAGIYHQVDILPFGIGRTDFFNSKSMNHRHTHVRDKKFVIEFHVPVVRQMQDKPEKKVGMITVIGNIGTEFARNLRKDTGLSFMFSMDGENWIFNEQDKNINKIVNNIANMDLTSGDLHNWELAFYDDFFYGIASYSINGGTESKFIFSGEYGLGSDIAIFQKAMFFVLLINILLILPLGFYFLRSRVLQPVLRLVSSVESIEQGEYKITTPLSGNDELTFLTNSFNSMALAIQQREHELQKLSLAVEQSPISMIITNLDGDIEYVNPAFTKITGYTFDDVIGKNTRLLKGEKISAEVFAQLWDDISNGRPWHGILHNKKKNGDFIWVSSSIIPIKAPDGEVINYLALNEDITERKHNEEQLYIQSSALQAAADGILITDKEGLAQCVNPAFERITGYCSDEIIGHTPRILKSGRQDDPYYKELWDTIKSGKTWQGELYNQRKDGSIYLEEESITPVLDDSGEITNFIAIKRDITAHHQQEEQLRHSQKMDALGKLTGGIAHDYNNMLGVILGYSDLLQTALSEQPKLAKYAHEIYHAGERGTKLTKKLLAFSRQKTSEEEVLNINMLLSDEQHMLEKTLTARIELVYDLEDNLWSVWLDAGDLEDAIVNLCINAMHAIEGSGQLNIKTSNEQVSTVEAPLLDLASGNYVVFSITDTGCGMDDATKQRIFDPFYSTKGDQGSGLGLSQVYGFVERSGGTIRVETELGHGTSFNLYFPQYQITNSNFISKKDNSMPASGGSESILIVDDEESLLEVTCEVLKNKGYNTFCANSSKHALTILEQEHIDLLLSDVIMPEMDGFQLAAIVQAKYPQVKIQLASGFFDIQKTEIDDEQKNFLHKPYKSQALLDRIRTLLDEKQISRQDWQKIAISENITIPFFKWSNQISVGIPQIDHDHKILIELINRCIIVVNNDEPAHQEINSILDELINYTQYHFQREELVMKICEDPGLVNHKQSHQQMIDKVKQYIIQYGLGELTQQELLGFLIDWLKNHIMVSDKLIANYYEGNESRVDEALKTINKDQSLSDD